MWKPRLIATYILLVLMLMPRNSRRDYHPDTQDRAAASSSKDELPPDVDDAADDEESNPNQERRAGQELFHPGYYLVHARVLSSRRDEDGAEYADLRIGRVYVGPPNLKGRTFEAVEYPDSGTFVLKEPDRDNPPLDKGEVGIWWIRETGHNDCLEAVLRSLDLAKVGGCPPSRKGILYKRFLGPDGRYHDYYHYYGADIFKYYFPPYEDALEYAAFCKKLDNAPDTPSQMAIFSQAVVSPNWLISNGAFRLLPIRRQEDFPESFIKECYKKLTVNPSVRSGHLRSIKSYLSEYQ